MLFSFSRFSMIFHDAGNPEQCRESNIPSTLTLRRSKHPSFARKLHFKKIPTTRGSCPLSCSMLMAMVYCSPYTTVQSLSVGMLSIYISVMFFVWEVSISHIKPCTTSYIRHRIQSPPKRKYTLAAKPSTQNRGGQTKSRLCAPPTFHLAPSVLNTRLDKSVYFLLGETILFSGNSSLHPRPKWSVQAVQLQCRLHVHCRYTATCWQCMCSVPKCWHKRPFCGVFAVYTAECSVPAVYLQCSSSVLAVYLQSRKLNYAYTVQAQCTLQSAVCQQCMSSLYCRYTAQAAVYLQFTLHGTADTLQVHSTSFWDFTSVRKMIIPNT